MSERHLATADFEALAEEILINGNSFRFQATGSSMRPFILNGDVVQIEPLAPASFKRGTIIFCRLSPNRLAVHRIVRVKEQVNEKLLLIQGDAMLQPDGWIPARQVIGVVSTVMRGSQVIRQDSPSNRAMSWLWIRAEPVRPVLLILVGAFWKFLKLFTV